MLIGLVNVARAALGAPVVDIAEVVQAQMRGGVASAWGFKSASCAVFPTEAAVPPGGAVLTIFDNADQADALGYHDETPSGKPYGRVFARPALDNGVSVSSVVSHEAVEMYGDPLVNLWAYDSRAYLWAVELCDPVEAVSYTPRGYRLEVSDFVTPAWFDPQSAGRTAHHTGGLAPFEVAPGGYAIRWKVGGQPSEVYGAHYPAWRRETKRTPAARTAKRVAA